MILVTGATGQLGQVVVENLLNTLPASQIAVLVRDENKAAILKAKGVSIRVGDYHNTASLAKAMQGIEKVLLISSSDFNDRLGQHKNVIDAAKNVGVSHIFYTSVSMKNIEYSPLKPLLADHFETEAYIKTSGLTYTFLKNSLYLDVIPMFLGENVVETGVFFPAGEGRVPFASRQELGEATAHILITEGHDNKAYPLVGSQMYSFGDVAEALSEMAQKNVAYVSPEPVVFETTLKSYGLPDFLVTMSSLFAAAIKNTDFELPDKTLERFLGRKTIDLTTFLEGVYKASEVA